MRIPPRRSAGPRASDAARLAALRDALGDAAGAPRAAAAEPPEVASPTGATKRRVPDSLVNFLLTGILASLFAWWLNARSHDQDLELATQTAAVAAVSDVSDLVNERRERAALVVSAIRRGAPESEVTARKLAYDEAYVRWNAKVPGDLLRIRAGLNLPYRSDYERYVDGLTNANVLLLGRPVAGRPGLLAIMDSCLTGAFDAYRADGFTATPRSAGIITACRFPVLYTQVVDCFSKISESIYAVINRVDRKGGADVSDQDIVQACVPQER